MERSTCLVPVEQSCIQKRKDFVELKGQQKVLVFLKKHDTKSEYGLDPTGQAVVIYSEDDVQRKPVVNTSSDE
jgi:hypothetical protein